MFILRRGLVMFSADWEKNERVEGRSLFIFTKNVSGGR